MMLELAPNPAQVQTQAYARCIATSKRVRWDIDADVIRGRRFEMGCKFLPDGLTKVSELGFLSPAERRYFSQVQGRTYANMFGLVERFVGAKVLELTGDHHLGDQVALEALLRFGEEELKHQELFRRVERLIADELPDGYAFPWDPNEVAVGVLAKSSWAVLGLTLHIELFTQAHYRESVEPDAELSPLFKDILLYHWREESQHAIMDELEWRRKDAALQPEARQAAVEELIDLIDGFDEILVIQARSDADYFLSTLGRRLTVEEGAAVHAVVRGAYRWQYILSGAQHPHFLKVLCELTTEAQQVRIMDALASLR